MKLEWGVYTDSYIPFCYVTTVRDAAAKNGEVQKCYKSTGDHKSKGCIMAEKTYINFVRCVQET